MRLIRQTVCLLCCKDKWRSATALLPSASALSAPGKRVVKFPCFPVGPTLPLQRLSVVWKPQFCRRRIWRILSEGGLTSASSFIVTWRWGLATNSCDPEVHAAGEALPSRKPSTLLLNSQRLERKSRSVARPSKPWENRQRLVSIPTVSSTPWAARRIRLAENRDCAAAMLHFAS